MSTPGTELDPAVVARIDARLDAVEAEHGVRIMWAVESGSRAWGFPSPDSDYDCRFLYVRPRSDYMSLWRLRDVIETPMDAVLDVNGWDLSKAIRLAAASNATVSEWLHSPLVYRGDPGFAEQMRDLCGRLVDLGRVRRHYQHVGLSHWEKSGAGRGGRSCSRSSCTRCGRRWLCGGCGCTGRPPRPWTCPRS